MFDKLKQWAIQNKLWAGLIAAGLTLLVVLMIPKSVPVDFATVSQGPMSVTITEEGETHIRDVYQLSAPITGRIKRVEVEPGDPVTAGVSVVASMEAMDPAILDDRSRAQAQAQVKAARAARASAAEDVERLKAEVTFAERDYQRIKTLREKGTVSQRALDQAQLSLDAKRAALRTALAVLDVRAFELATAEAALIEPENREDGSTVFPIKSPIDGVVLTVLQESETVLAAGMPIASLGNPRDLEVVVDVLSADAVKISEGAEVIITDWGGDEVLNGVVTRVEPFGVTKISALGIEEQRVNIKIGLTGDQAMWARLGHGFRVTTNIVIWHDEMALQVPLGALFREKNEWAVMVAKKNKARLQIIQVGKINRDTAQVLSGLDAGDQVVLHPGPQVADGVRVTGR